jgi:hypothetical protein
MTMRHWGVVIECATFNCVCGLASVLLVACDDAADAVVADGAAGDATAQAATGGEGAEPALPLTFKVEGSLCGEAVAYEGPADTKLTLVLTPSGQLRGLLFGDGPPIKVNEPTAVAAYAKEHDILASIGLEEPATLEQGSLGSASGTVLARGFGSMKLSGTDTRALEIDLYQPGKRISGALTHEVSWYGEMYPGGDVTCSEGNVTVSFDGGFIAWDGQDDCFSPTRNLDRLATGELLLGCACDSQADAPVCVGICEDPAEASGEGASCDGFALGMFCVNGQWLAGNDGPCGP